jgi:multisubunit Na+/H+ antiporter MnhE subunit
VTPVRATLLAVSVCLTPGLLSLELCDVHEQMLSGILDGTAAEQEARVISEHVDVRLRLEH